MLSFAHQTMEIDINIILISCIVTEILPKKKDFP